MSEKFNFINRFLLKHNLIEPTNYIAQNIKKFELKWWIVKIITLIQENFFHFLIEFFLITIILYIIFRNPTKKKDIVKLSIKEEDELINEWLPQKLIDTYPLKKDKIENIPIILESGTNHIIKANNGQEYINFASTNFLALAGHSSILNKCQEIINVYGVGSCGPRGFYGSIDIHIELEQYIAKFLKVKEAILYSDSIACISSVIPAFAKRDDIIICDEKVSYGIQTGINLSRSKVIYFQHNNMKDLESKLKQVVHGDDKKGLKGQKKAGKISL